MAGGFTDMTMRSCLMSTLIIGVTLQTLGGQSTSSQAGKASTQQEPSSISMPYSNMAWRGTLTVSASEITEQVTNDKPGITYKPAHYPYEQLKYCSFYDNRPESSTPPDLLGTTIAGRKIAYHGYGPGLWIIVKRKNGGYNGFAIASDYARQFYQAAKIFGKHCGPSTPEIQGPEIEH